MRDIDRRRVLAVIGAGMVGACTKPAEVVKSPEPKAPPAPVGGIAIFGTLTDFGSLSVNGLRIETDGKTSVSNAFGEVVPGALAIGQVLTIEAEAVPGALIARRVYINYPVIGAIGKVSPDRRRITVLGIEIELAGGLDLTLGPGKGVAVSGLWNGERIVATLVSPFPDRNLLAGTLRIDERKRLSVGGVRLRLAKEVEAPPAGSYVSAWGTPRRRYFKVKKLDQGRFTGAAGALKQLSVEGYLEPVDTPPGFEISGLGTGFDPKARLEPFRATRTLFSGRYDGRFLVETGVPLSEDVLNRRAALRQAQAEGFGRRALLAR